MSNNTNLMLTHYTERMGDDAPIVLINTAWDGRGSSSRAEWRGMTVYGRGAIDSVFFPTSSPMNGGLGYGWNQPEKGWEERFIAAANQ